jgi:bacterioferritin-associated ferredoxin
VIVCSCNVLSEARIIAALRSGNSSRPRSALEAHRCLGCAPRCGRCLGAIRKLIADAHLANCEVGCPTCPGADAHSHEAHEPAKPFLIAAE